jgi:hypothetical protein
LIKLLGVLELMFVIKKENKIVVTNNGYTVQPSTSTPLALFGMRMHMGKLSKGIQVCKLRHLRIVKPLNFFITSKGSVMVAQEGRPRRLQLKVR